MLLNKTECIINAKMKSIKKAFFQCSLHSRENISEQIGLSKSSWWPVVCVLYYVQARLHIVIDRKFICSLIIGIEQRLGSSLSKKLGFRQLENIFYSSNLFFNIWHRCFHVLENSIKIMSYMFFHFRQMIRLSLFMTSWQIIILLIRY